MAIPFALIQAGLKAASDNTNRRRAFDSGLAALASSPFSDVAANQAARVNFGQLAQNNSVGTLMTGLNSGIAGQKLDEQNEAKALAAKTQQDFENGFKTEQLQALRQQQAINNRFAQAQLLQASGRGNQIKFNELDSYISNGNPYGGGI